MKKLSFVSALLFLGLWAGEAAAQCSFTPTVTPGNVVLCPNETDTLWTQTYDSYQWYQDGAAIPGATLQYLVINQATAAGSYFKVNATQSACTEMSDSVMVDGWAYLPPFVIHGGNYTINPNDGSSLLCAGVDTMVLTFSYPANIQWFKDGVAIPGATTNELKITQPGSYLVQGAPAVCPNNIATLGVSIDVSYITAHISPDDLMLCPNAIDTLMVDSGSNFQWYKDGVLIPGATNQQHPVEQYADAGSWFSATATVMGCNVRADSVLVDGWAFASLSVSSSGNFTIGDEGEALLCSGDTLFLEVLPPYTQSVQWYKNGSVITGANNVVYKATESGDYTVKGSPVQCPDFSQNNFGLPIAAEFRAQPALPVITQTGGVFTVTPVVPTLTYQWYKDGVAIAGATGATYNPAGQAGNYTVKVTDGSGCSNTSAVFNYNPTAIHDPNGIAGQIRVYPSPAKDMLYIKSPVKVNAALLRIDGGVVMRQQDAAKIDISGLAEGMYLLQLRDKEGNFIKAEKIIKLN